jgi:uncharacterized protein YgfB (UPF0149 family)
VLEVEQQEQEQLDKQQVLEWVRVLPQLVFAQQVQVPLIQA